MALNAATQETHNLPALTATKTHLFAFSSKDRYSFSELRVSYAEVSKKNQRLAVCSY